MPPLHHVQGSCVKSLHGHNSAVLFVGAAEDGERMLTGSGDRKVRLCVGWGS